MKRLYSLHKPKRHLNNSAYTVPRGAFVHETIIRARETSNANSAIATKIKKSPKKLLTEPHHTKLVVKAYRKVNVKSSLCIWYKSIYTKVHNKENGKQMP